MLLYSAVIAAGLVVLVWSADRFVDGASAIADRAGLSPMLIGLTIVSVGT
ncbi:MAG: calcium/sodium antiporter, partial [Halieaceae bacterium]